MRRDAYASDGAYVAGAGGGGVPGGVADGGDGGVTQPPGLHVQCPHLVGRHGDGCAGGARRRRRCQGGVVVSGARTSPACASSALVSGVEYIETLNSCTYAKHASCCAYRNAQLELCEQPLQRRPVSNVQRGTSSNFQKEMRAAGQAPTASPQHSARSVFPVRPRVGSPWRVPRHRRRWWQQTTP